MKIEYGTAYRLELGEDAGGEKYYLDSRSVQGGTFLELLMPKGKWLRGRIEWGPHAQDRRPEFWITIGGQVKTEASLKLPPNAIVCWPASQPE